MNTVMSSGPILRAVLQASLLGGSALGLLLGCGGASQHKPVDSTADQDTSQDSDSSTDSGTESGMDTDTHTDSEMDTADKEPEPLCETVPRQNLQASSDAPSGGAVFRFRTYSGSTPSWVSDLKSTSLNLADGSSLNYAERGPGVDGITPFRNRPVTVFSGGDYWLASEDIEAEDLSIEAWFRTGQSTGWQTLFSNTEGGGFSLKIKDGQLRGLFRVKDGSSWDSLEHIGSIGVSDDRWHHAVFTVDRRSDGYQLCLWLDGEKECVLRSDTRSPKDSSIGPSVGAEPNEDGGVYTFTDHFSGEIYGVVVHDFVLSEGWLADRVLRDGSRYFDTPSYHDYLSGSDGVAQRMDDSIEPHPALLEATAARYRLPFQDDRFVVQGVGSHSSGEVFLSMYYGAKDLHSTCSEEPYTVNSLIVGFDPCDSELTRVLMLYGPDGTINKAHVGGMAVVRNWAWTTHSSTSGTVLAKYSLEPPTVREPVSYPVSEDLLPSGMPWRAEAVVTHEVPEGCGSSYMSFERGQNRLWLGQFSTSSGAEVCAVELDSNGDLQETAGTWTLPIAKVQGVLALEDGRLLLSQSYGNSDSALYIWTPGSTSATKVLSGPAGFEDLALSPEGLVWTASESGARYFQKRFGENLLCGPSWTDLYPYAFALDPSTFLPE
ncbi:MAG: LamG-like jellyroll fold domain-containing protein [Myxococcota bacterium]|nr:LamG-like jellyroll fold domain-containing protein [Myxococcota bacterium]